MSNNWLERILDKFWSYKYKPQTIDEFIYSKKDKLINQLNDQDTLRHMMIYSDHHGVGKTTLAKLIASSIFKQTNTIYFNARTYCLFGEDIFKKDLNSIMKRLFQSGGRRKIILDDFDMMSLESQQAIISMAEQYDFSNIVIFVYNDLTRAHPKIKSECIKIDLEGPAIEDIEKYLQKILEKEEIDLEGLDFNTFIQRRYPNIKSMVQDLQETIVSGEIPIVLNTNSFSDFYTKIYDLIINEKNLEEIQKILKENKDAINRRYLNKYIWNKSIEDSNVRLIQITESNEVKFAQKCDVTIIFDTSLIEMVK